MKIVLYRNCDRVVVRIEQEDGTHVILPAKSEKVYVQLIDPQVGVLYGGSFDDLSYAVKNNDILNLQPENFKK